MTTEGLATTEHCRRNGRGWVSLGEERRRGSRLLRRRGGAVGDSTVGGGGLGTVLLREVVASSRSRRRSSRPRKGRWFLHESRYGCHMGTHRTDNTPRRCCCWWGRNPSSIPGRDMRTGSRVSRHRFGSRTRRAKTGCWIECPAWRSSIAATSGTRSS
jgi:hypothetical protein